MFPLIQNAVISKGWITQEMLIDFVAVSESTPGPFAINISTYIGAEMGGLLGSISATFGVVLPSFIIILILAKFFIMFKENKIVKKCMDGLKPCVIGLMASSILSMVITVFMSSGITNMEIVMLFIILLLSLFLVFKKIHPIIVICVSALIGIVSGFVLI